MPKELQPFQHKPDTINDEEDLSSIPGNYYRAAQDIGARTETTERDQRYGFGRGTSLEKETVTYKARRAVEGGTVLLVAKLNFLDEMLHSVTMSAHPADVDQSPLVFMADEFFNHFVKVDGEAVRGAEIAAVHEHIGSLQARLAAPPPMADLLPPAGTTSPGTQQLMKAISRREDLEARAQAITVAAEAHQKQIKEGVEEIKSATTLLTRYYGEKANAMMARVGDTLEFASNMKEGLKTLSLYTGDGVTVIDVASGESAPADLPLTLYQDRLYFDEELAVDLATGGFDFRGIDDIGEVLAADASVLDRICPAQRGAVLLRVRRSSREYVTGPGSDLANAMMNLMNQKVYLLVRNGENVHLVNSEITTDNAERLFPTKKEIDDLFRRHEMEIKPEHLDYARAKNEFERQTVFYKRMLLMLWGLQDRLGLFGNFYDKDRFGNWYDEEFQRERVVYVHDGENTLEVKRPSFAEWIRERNGHIRNGSRMAVNWYGMLNPQSAPSCSKTRGDIDYLYRHPAFDHGIAEIFMVNGRPTISCPIKATGTNKPFNAKVDVAWGLDYNTFAGVCIDGLKSADLEYYLNSRKQRANYLAYLDLFRYVRDTLVAEEEAQADTRTTLIADLSVVGVDGNQASTCVDDAVVLWRQANGSRLIGDGDWKASDRNTVLDIAFALCGKRADIMDRIRKDAPDLVPLELRVDGKGNIILYHENRSQMLVTEEAQGRIFVERSAVTVGKTKVTVKAGKRAYLANPTFEGRAFKAGGMAYNPTGEKAFVVLDGASDWQDRWLPGNATAEWVQAVESAAHFDVERYIASASPMAIGQAILDVMYNKKGRYVASTSIVIPVAVGIAKGTPSNDGVMVLALEANALHFLVLLGEEGVHEARRIINARYKTPEGQLERLDSMIRNKQDILRAVIVSSPEYVRKLDAGPIIVDDEKSPFYSTSFTRSNWGGGVEADQDFETFFAYLVRAGQNGSAKTVWPCEANRAFVNNVHRAAVGSKLEKEQG